LGGVSGKIRLGVEKTVCSGFWIQKTRLFCPYENLGGGTAALSPFQRSPHSADGSLPPLLGQNLHSCPATKGTYPLGFPTDLCPLRRPQIRQKRLGFRLRSPLPSREEPCTLRLQTVFFTHKPSQNRGTDFAGAKPACFRYTQPDLLHILLSQFWGCFQPLSHQTF